jgi:hypothetical protein
MEPLIENWFVPVKQQPKKAGCKARYASEIEPY